MPTPPPPATPPPAVPPVPAHEVAPLPPEVSEVLTRFLCCEVSTLTAAGAPVTWPAVALFLPETGQLVLSTSIGFPFKALNLRRDPRVSLLFSDPTGSGLTDPPHVLVQGRAQVSDDVRTWGGDLTAHWARVSALQPVSRFFSRTPPVRWFMGFYYQRLLIHITPDRIRFWPHGNTTATPHQTAAPAAPAPPAAAAPDDAGPKWDGVAPRWDEPMWDELSVLLPEFPTAVLTGLDQHDRPTSVRVTPLLNPTAGVLRGPLPPGLGLRRGPASLLCHRHDDNLWGLRSVLVRGDLDTTATEWVLTPTALVRGQGFGGPLGDARTFLAARRRAARYRHRRGITAPPIPWDQVRAQHHTGHH